MQVTEQLLAEARLMLGEVVVDGETDESLISDEQLSSWFDQADSIDYVLLRGWQAKEANWANLVNVVDGAAARNFSDLMAHATEKVAYYNQRLYGRSGRARVGKIIRNS